MGTLRISSTQSAPTTFFSLEADVIATDHTGRGRWKLRLYLYCRNDGNTSSYSSYPGVQVGYLNGTEFGRHSGNPFLDSGFSNGATRWYDGPWDVWVNANSQGYFTGVLTSFPLSMLLAYDNGGVNTQPGGSITLARLVFVPGASGNGTLSSRTDTSLTVGWTAPTDDGNTGITGYDTQIATNAAMTGATQAAQGNSTSKVFSGLTPNTTYYTRQRPVNAQGVGPWSTVQSFTTTTVPGTPAVPVLASKTTTTINLTNTDPGYVGDGVTARQTELSLVDTFSSTVATNTTLTPAFTGLTRATVYYARFRVQNAVGWGPWSATLIVTTDSDVPSTPTGYAAHDVASRTAFSTMGSILDNGGFALAQLNYQINTSATSVGSTDVTLDSAREPRFLGLTQGTTYYYRQRVFNGQFWSGWGAWVSFTTTTNVPTAPTSFASSAITDTTVTTTWAAPATLNGATVTGYRVRVARDKAMTVGLQTYTVAAATLSQVFTGLTPGVVHYLDIVALTNNGDSSITDILSFTTTNTGTTIGLNWENVSGTWKRVTDWENVGGVWKQITYWENVAGVWKKN